MIQHLNQFSFYKYGLRKQEGNGEIAPVEDRPFQQIAIDWEKQTVFLSLSETWIFPDSTI